MGSGLIIGRAGQREKGTESRTVDAVTGPRLVGMNSSESKLYISTVETRTKDGFDR